MRAPRQERPLRRRARRLRSPPLTPGEPPPPSWDLGAPKGAPCPICAGPRRSDGSCPRCGPPPAPTFPTKGLACCLLAGLCVVSWLALRGLQASWKVGGEAPPIGALKTLNSAQTLFREADMEKDGTLDYGSLAELAQAHLVDDVLGGGEKGGYRFTCEPSAATPEFLWFATANPVQPGSTGDRYFATNHSGVIYYSIEAPITAGPDCAIVRSDVHPVGK